MDRDKNWKYLWWTHCRRPVLAHQRGKMRSARTSHMCTLHRQVDELELCPQQLIIGLLHHTQIYCTMWTVVVSLRDSCKGYVSCLAAVLIDHHSPASTGQTAEGPAGAHLERRGLLCVSVFSCWALSPQTYPPVEYGTLSYLRTRDCCHSSTYVQRTVFSFWFFWA